MQSGDGELKLGGLGVQRDFVDVRDVARAVHAASLSAAQGVVNIGSGPRRPAARRRRRPRPGRRLRRRPARTRHARPAPSGPSIGHPRPEPGPRGPASPYPVPGRLRQLAAGRRAHRPRPARLAAPDQPRGVPRRHLDGGGMPHLTTARRPAPRAPAPTARLRHPRLCAPAASPRRMGRTDPPRHPAALGRPQRRRRPRRPPRPALPGGRRAGCATRASGSSATSTWRTARASFGELVSDAHRFLDWYRVDGFLLDRCPTERTRSARDPAYGRRTLRALLGGGAHRPRPRHPPASRICGDRRPAGHLLRAAGPTTAGRRWPSGPRTIRPSASATSCTVCRAAHLDEALRIARWQGAGHDLLHRPHGPRRPDRPLGDACPATGTKSSRGSDRVSRNERGRGSVTGRTTVVIDRPTESPCRCHPWSSQLPSSPSTRSAGTPAT